MSAYNFNYIAIIKLIEKYHLNKNAKVIVHGSGGMAKAVVAAFKNSGFEKLKIYAHNVKTSQYLAALYGYEYIDSLEENQKADILVNVTPIGMKGGKEEMDLAFPKALIDSNASVAFDVVLLPALKHPLFVMPYAPEYKENKRFLERR